MAVIMLLCHWIPTVQTVKGAFKLQIAEFAGYQGTLWRVVLGSDERVWYSYWTLWRNVQIWKSDSLQFQNRQCCPRANPRALDFFEKFWSNSRYVASLDGQMPHPLELQRGSNPPPSRHVKANYGNKFRKIFSHYKFLVQFVFAPHFKQRHIPR